MLASSLVAGVRDFFFDSDLEMTWESRGSGLASDLKWACRVEREGFLEGGLGGPVVSIPERDTGTELCNLS